MVIINAKVYTMEGDPIEHGFVKIKDGVRVEACPHIRQTVTTF